MKEEKIQRYAEMMDMYGLSRLHISENGTTVELERTAGFSNRSADPGDTEAAAVPARRPAKETVVTSPLVGVFYAAPAENADPYVTVGQAVEEGDVLCIVEAMKLMNEIRAERSGTVTEILATNGQVVEFGTPLFRIGGTA